MIVTRILVSATLVLSLTGPAGALERLCDPAFEDCRAPLITLIDRESVGIDVAFWFMEDLRYSAALHRAHARGVPIRVLMDTRANGSYPGNVPALRMLRDAGIPMREKTDSGILHWKMMLFVGQRTVQFSGANYSSEAFVPIVPWINYVDEVIYFTDRPALVESFMRKYDDVWTSTSGYRDYANVTSVGRRYPMYPIDPELNFPPGGFRDRSVARYRAETQGIDAIIYRITDGSHTDALIEAMRRGVPVRILTEPHQYRDRTREWHSWNIDRLWMAGQQTAIGGQPGIHIRHRRHAGLNHEKLTLLSGQGMTILGSSNWTSASDDSQLEHNLFTTDPSVSLWAREHFDRKWFNRGPHPETRPFAPLPPDRPTLLQPGNGSMNQPVELTLRWDGGPWAHRYDVYLGTSPNSLVKIVDDQQLGPYTRTVVVANLRPDTVYYWRVVGRTMANLSRSSATCRFRTAGELSGRLPDTPCLPPPPDGADPVAVDEPQDILLPPVVEEEPEETVESGAGGQLSPEDRAPSSSGARQRSRPSGAPLTGTRAIPRDD